MLFALYSKKQNKSNKSKKGTEKNKIKNKNTSMNQCRFFGFSHRIKCGFDFVFLSWTKLQSQARRSWCASSYGRREVSNDEGRKLRFVVLVAGVGVARVLEPRTSSMYSKQFELYDGTVLDLSSTGYFKALMNPVASFGVYHRQYTNEELEEFERQRKQEFEELKERRESLMKSMSSQQYQTEYIDKDQRYKIPNDPALDHIKANNFVAKKKNAKRLENREKFLLTDNNSNNNQFLTNPSFLNDNNIDTNDNLSPSGLSSAQEFQQKLMDPGRSMNNLHIYYVQFLQNDTAVQFWKSLFE
ncbi:hypothetical protein RFI_16370, partial [Reticulomyxa filosa]